RRWRTSGTESRMHVSCLYFFFLQAEDGIRDFHVTGVQTCALPIYDAPALASADLGMAVGSGAHVAADAADLILVRDELTVVPDAIRLARSTLRTIRGNLVWAFGYNLAAVPLAALGLLNPLLAGGAMALSSLFVVSNSQRLRRFSGARAG